MRFKIHSVIPYIHERDYSMGGEGRGDDGEGRWWWGWVIYSIITKELHTYRHTYRPSDEAGPRGAFAPKNMNGNVW